MEMRKILDEEKPGMTFAEMNALIALKWKVGAGFFLNELISLLYIRIMDKNANFSSVGWLQETSDKQIWNDKAAAAKERYTAEMEEYIKDAVMTWK